MIAGGTLMTMLGSGALVGGESPFCRVMWSAEELVFVTALLGRDVIGCGYCRGEPMVPPGMDERGESRGRVDVRPVC